MRLKTLAAIEVNRKIHCLQSESWFGLGLGHCESKYIEWNLQSWSKTAPIQVKEHF